MVVINANSDMYYRIRLTYTNDYFTPGIAHVEFRNWLESYGGKIEPENVPVPENGMYWICDSVGIIPHIHRIVFDNEKKYTLFALRVS